MADRSEFTEIWVEEDLLPQVIRELTELAEDQNHVEVTHGVSGRVVLAHPVLAEIWYQKVMAKNAAEEAAVEPAETTTAEEPAAEPVEPVAPVAPVVVAEAPGADKVSPESTTFESTSSESTKAPTEEWVPPVKRGPGRPRKYPPAPSVSNGEES